MLCSVLPRNLVSKETLPKPPGGNTFHESSFRFKGPVSERKDDDTKVRYIHFQVYHYYIYPSPRLTLPPFVGWPLSLVQAISHMVAAAFPSHLHLRQSNPFASHLLSHLRQSEPSTLTSCPLGAQDGAPQGPLPRGLRRPAAVGGGHGHGPARVGQARHAGHAPRYARTVRRTYLCVFC